jgi:hypothetical protein
MVSLVSRRTPRSQVLFWGLMVACGALALVCVYLAVGELGQPWGDFPSTPTVPLGMAMTQHWSILIFSWQ